MAVKQHFKRANNRFFQKQGQSHLDKALNYGGVWLAVIFGCYCWLIYRYHSKLKSSLNWIRSEEADIALRERGIAAWQSRAWNLDDNIDTIVTQVDGQAYDKFGRQGKLEHDGTLDSSEKLGVEATLDDFNDGVHDAMTIGNERGGFAAYYTDAGDDLETDIEDWSGIDTTTLGGYSREVMMKLLQESLADIDNDLEQRPPTALESVPPFGISFSGIKYTSKCFDSDGAGLKSSYCSLGRVRPVLTSIDTPDAVTRVVQARVFQKELILMVSDKGHLEMTLNAIFGLEDRGFAHYLILMPAQYDCLYAAQFLPSIGCVWSDMFKQVGVPGWLWHHVRRIWLLRWMVFCRLLQRGVNVLMADTDNVMLHDFYRFAKDPTFRRFTLMLPTEPTIPGINAGAVYGQNAHPRGPAAWMAAEVSVRTMRALDDLPAFLATLPSQPPARVHVDLVALYEQNLYNDAASSAMLGRPVLYHTLAPDKSVQRPQFEAWQLYHKQLCGRAQGWRFAVPAGWREVAKAEWEEAKWWPLLLPRLGTHWPPEIRHFAARPFPPEGPLSRQLRGWLEAEGPTWPRPEQPDPEGLRRIITSEKLLVSPGWFMGRYGDLGAKGWWDPQLVNTPAVVLGHLIVPAIPLVDSEAKVATYKLYGWWHWRATTLLFDGPPLKAQAPANVSVLGEPFPRLLALAPWVPMLTLTVPMHFWIVHHLLRVAVLTRRLLVFPPAHCLSHWAVLRYPWDPQVAAHPVETPFVRVYGGLRNLQCLHMTLMNSGCAKVGIQPYDFDQLLTQLPPVAAKPSRYNTLLFPNQTHRWPTVVDPASWIPHQEMAAGRHYPWPERPRVLDATWLAAELEKYNQQPVLYLGATVAVRDFPEDRREELTELLRTCQHKYLAANHEDQWW